MQTGQPELVLELGELALSKRDSGTHKRDILLSMALAHCSLSSVAFESRDQVVFAFMEPSSPYLPLTVRKSCIRCPR